MRLVLQVISGIALVATLLPAVFYANGAMTLPSVKSWMLAATVAWFVTTPMWMDRKG